MLHYKKFTPMTFLTLCVTRPLVEHTIPIDYEAYLQRLGFSSRPTPTLENLRLLHERHTAEFPFQTLTTVMHQPVSLDWHDMENKVITTRQGGYCYELNILFYGLLSLLGYDAAILTGHVIHNSGFVRRTSRTHIIVKITIDGEDFICDVGHGGYTPTAPLRLAFQGPQQTTHGTYAFVHKEDSYYLRSLIAHEWQTLYGFDLQPPHWTDLEVGNWYVSTHPQSHFLSTLMVARTEEGGKRHSLLNNRYSLHTVGQKTLVQRLGSALEVIELIESVFNLNIPEKKLALESIETVIQSLVKDTAELTDDCPT